MRASHAALILSLLLAAAVTPCVAAPAAANDPAPTAGDWAALGKLPDWSGVWIPDVMDQ